MGALQACLAPEETRQRQKTKEEKEGTKATEEKGTEKRRQKGKRRNAVKHQQETGLKVLVVGVEARDIKNPSVASKIEAYNAQQKLAGQMAALSGSSTSAASHATDYVTSLKQDLSCMDSEAVSSKRPLLDSGAAALACVQYSGGELG
eukprot:1103800-Amphidinium_carterae.4